MSFPVWQYWEGPMPAYIELCHETVRRHYPAARALDRSSFDELWRVERDVPIDHLRAEHRADFVRAYLLHQYGGLWIDSDFVVLRRLARLDDLPERCTFAGYRIDSGEYTNNLMFAKPDDPIAARFYEVVVRHLRERRPISWLEIGSDALHAAVAESPQAYYELPRDRVCPVPWHEGWRFEQEGSADSLVDTDRWGVMLSNSTASEQLRSRGRDAVLADRTVLGDLIRRALA